MTESRATYASSSSPSPELQSAAERDFATGSGNREVPVRALPGPSSQFAAMRRASDESTAIDHWSKTPVIPRQCPGWAPRSRRITSFEQHEEESPSGVRPAVSHYCFRFGLAGIVEMF